MKLSHLCVTCHGPQFVEYLAKRPDASLRCIARWAKRRFDLDAEPTSTTLNQFLARLGVERLSREESSEARRVLRQAQARWAGLHVVAGVKRPELVRSEHRAVASAASVFSLAQHLGVEQ